MKKTIDYILNISNCTSVILMIVIAISSAFMLLKSFNDCELKFNISSFLIIAIVSIFLMPPIAAINILLCIIFGFFIKKMPETEFSKSRYYIEYTRNTAMRKAVELTNIEVARKEELYKNFSVLREMEAEKEKAFLKEIEDIKEELKNNKA